MKDIPQESLFNGSLELSRFPIQEPPESDEVERLVHICSLESFEKFSPEELQLRMRMMPVL